MTDDPRTDSALIGWACAKCGGRNQPEDRYCGDCGGSRNETITAPVIRPAQTASGLLTNIAEPAGGARGAPFVLLGGLAASALFGALYHYAARVRDLKILFPILLGLGVAWAIRVVAIRSRCRSAALLAGAAILSGIAAYSVRQALDTVQVRDQKLALLAEQARDESMIEGKTTQIHFGFWDALRYRAAMGIGFDFGRRGDGSALRGNWFWFFLLVECGLVAGVAAASVRHVSRLAYCNRCRAFIPTVPVFRVNARDAALLSDAVRRQKWKESQEMSNRASAGPRDRAEALLLRCVCGANSLRIDVHEGRRFKSVMHVSLPPESLETLARSA